MVETTGAEPFPALSPSNTAQDIPARPSAETDAAAGNRRRRASTTSSAVSAGRSRGASLLQSFQISNPPLGMWQATGEVLSKVPTLPQIKSGEFAADGWSHEGQLESRGVFPHEIQRKRKARTSSISQRRKTTTSYAPAAIQEGHEAHFPSRPHVVDRLSREEGATNQPHVSKPGGTVYEPPDINANMEQPVSSNNSGVEGPDESGTYPNGYRFPKKHTWSQATAIGLRAFWKFVCTPFGIIITIYGLNVVGWGAMIFFVLLNAAPAMCHPSCNDDHSARKIWIEIDSQVLNALFCVTGFGLAPWRFRDLYFLLRWRILKQEKYHRILAGICRSWYRLPNSDLLPEHLGPPPIYSKKNPQLPESPPPYSKHELAVLEANSAIPLPPTSMPEAPLTGIRSKPTNPWLIDVVVWMYVLNTLFQITLAAFMWIYDRFTRPSWATGFFITVGCCVAIAAGIVVFLEGSKIKKIEGMPVHEYDVLETAEDFQKRKAKETAKALKRQKPNQEKSIDDVEMLRKTRTRTRKVKGDSWFTRH